MSDLSFNHTNHRSRKRKSHNQTISLGRQESPNHVKPVTKKVTFKLDNQLETPEDKKYFRQNSPTYQSYEKDSSQRRQ